MMAARLLRHTPPEKQGRFARRTGEFFDRVIRRYGEGLRWVLERQPLTLLVFLATVALTALLYLAIPKGFFPVQDTGLIQGISEGPQSASFEAMSQRSRTLARILLEDPAVQSVSSFIGVDGTNITPNAGRLLIQLKPHGERPRASVVIDRLKQRVARQDGIALYMQPVQDLTIEDRVSRTQFQYTLESADPQALREWTARMVAKLGELPQLADVASDLQDQGLQAYVTIDRDTAGRLGVTPASIDNALYNAFGQRLVSTIFTQASQYRVVLEVKPEFRRGPGALEDIFVPGAGGVQVPLSSVATVSERTGPLAVSHIGQFPAQTISFNLGPGYSLGQAVGAIERAQRELGVPASVRASFQGAASAFRASLLDTLLRHHVHRVGRALRELHPPGHDPLDAALGGRGGAALAHGRRAGPRHHRDHRHHPAHRDREEERDPHGRLRPRRRARGGPRSPRGDLPGRAASLPAHPHDHARRAAGRPPPHALLGRGRGAAPPARDRDGGRARLLAAAHHLHHARDLPLFRSLGTALAQGTLTRTLSQGRGAERWKRFREA
jgi:hypothetical protein